MTDFMNGLLIALQEGLITKKVALVYMQQFMSIRFEVSLSKEELEKINATK